MESEIANLPGRYQAVVVFDALASVANLTTDDLDASVVRRMLQQKEKRGDAGQGRRRRELAATATRVENPPVDEEE